jgi:hypothetical protein
MNLSVYDSLSEEAKKTYNSNYQLAARIIARLQKYQISDEIISQTPIEVVHDLLTAEEASALKETNYEVH